MKRKEEKRRKFHEGLLKMLYPSPSSPSHQRESSEEAENTHSEGLGLDLVPDEYENERSSSSSSSWASDHEGGCEPQKLTRAQRKRIRRKKMKEAASRRQKIIGPLLPNASDMGAEIADEHPPGVRQNAQTPEEAAWSTKQNKVKQRRMAKKLGGESSTLSGMASSDAGSGPFNNASSKEP